MNREIKFRAWDNINNEMRYPAKKDVFATGPTSGDFIDKWDTVMQFTGLHDKNGKEIYEGDLVVNTTVRKTWGQWDGVYGYKDVITETVEPVVFDAKWAAFKLTTRGEWGRFEVIGNIYEHPHLIS